MYLQKISVFQFKNITSFDLQPSPHINIICGPNGTGKTNLLESIYFLCLTKGFSPATDLQCIQFGKDQFFIKGLFSEKNEVIVSLKRGEKKNLSLDKEFYNKLSDHIGKIPCVLVTPYDLDLLRGGSELRRKFVDGLLAQSSNKYLDDLLSYNKTMKQRNALISMAAERNQRPDKELIEQYDSILIDKNLSIYQKRLEFINQIEPIVQEYYAFISDAKEEPQLEHKSDVQVENFSKSFKDNYESDLFKQRTLLGIHTDDFIFKLDSRPVKKYGSQGQQKSFLLALKLAQTAYLKKISGKNPVLLLDDLLEKLDSMRLQKLIEILDKRITSQVFITDPNPEDMNKLSKRFVRDTRVIELDTNKFE